MSDAFMLNSGILNSLKTPQRGTNTFFLLMKNILTAIHYTTSDTISSFYIKLAKSKVIMKLDNQSHVLLSTYPIKNTL